MLDLSYMAERISSARKDMGFTQEELSVRLGVSAQAVSKWERALSTPDVELLLALSQILNISVDMLLKADAQPLQKAAESAYDFRKHNIMSPQRINDQMIIISFGKEITPLFSDDYIACFSAMRIEIFSETGVVLPVIRIRDDIKLSGLQITIEILGNEIWNKTYTELSDNINISIKDEIISQLKLSAKKILPDFVNRHMTKVIVENIRSNAPFIVEGVIPERISLSRLRSILKELVAGGVSIRNIAKIIEIIDDSIEFDDELLNDKQRLINVLKEKL